jgi:antitoxin component of MazEF toxin-antitoxin module
MTTLKLYYGGWLALPAALRQTLGVGTGDRLEAELVDGTLRLRPAAAIKGAAENEPEAPAPAAEAPAPASSSSAPTSARHPSRRLLQAAVPQPPEPVTTPERPLARLRKAKPAPAPEPASLTEEEARAESGRKVALPLPREAPVAVRGRVRAWVMPTTGHEREERRPFPHVEVRKLGPGRRHHRSRGQQL